MTLALRDRLVVRNSFVVGARRELALELGGLASVFASRAERVVPAREQVESESLMDKQQGVLRPSREMLLCGADIVINHGHVLDAVGLAEAVYIAMTEADQSGRRPAQMDDSDRSELEAASLPKNSATPL